MARNKNLFLVMDTETTGEIPQQIAYDVGWVVCDRSGKIYHRFHAVVREVFANLPMMATAYYANKFPNYLDAIRNQEMEVLTFAEILQRFEETVNVFHIKTLCAYNLSFDLRAMSNTQKWLTGKKWWMSYELNQKLEKFCIMRAACEVLMGYQYVKTCRANGWETDKGNPKTSAEMAYRYITKDFQFEEAHRGLQDCEIEAEILAACFRKHKKFDHSPAGFPQRKVYAKERHGNCKK